MIEIEDLKKTYNGKIEALKGISFKVKKGEIALFLGPNGAGKTTAIKIILGLRRADSGRVNLFSHNIGYMPEGEIGKKDWKVEDYLKFLAQLRGVQDVKNKVDKLLEKYNAKEMRKMKLRELSKGMRQRIKWIQAVLSEPEILILDEPTSGFDPLGKIEIRKWIKEKKEEGRTILISSHLLDEMEKTGDNYTIINNGLIVNKGRIDEIKEKGLEEHFYEVVKGS
ncbi:MAG: ABC transporter ATP-binding protein [Candidatus Aminicenantia bacterium]